MNQIRSFTVFFLLAFFSATQALAGQNIGALGRILPQSGIVSLTGTPGDVIDRIHVAAGDRVEKDQVLVSFASKKRLAAEVAAARASMERITAQSDMAIDIQKKKLKTVRDKFVSLIALQKAALRTAKEDLAYAQSGLARLLKSGKDSFSTQQKEAREHQQSLAKIRLDSAVAELARIEQDRAAQLALGQLELDRLTTAKAHNLAQAKEQLETVQRQYDNADLTAPISGTVMDVLLKNGETAGSVPIIRMADLSVMTVVTDVFQADLLKVKVGMEANIESKALPKTLTGKVAGIGREIRDPSKVARVDVVLDAPDLAARLINLEVEVSILTGQ